MNTASTELIRTINSRLVLEAIIKKGQISRASLAKQLGLTKTTISAIVQELLDQRLVLEIGSDNTEFGRKPILISFYKQAGYAAAIDIGYETVSMLLTDLQGEIVTVKQLKTPPKERLIRELTALIETASPLFTDAPYGLVGITLAIHGVVNDQCISFSPYYNIKDLPLRDELSSTFHVPVFLENEANLSALGEYAKLQNPVNNLVGISIHSGVGLGLILDKKLYTGSHGRAGEFGHTVLYPGGRSCPCGNKGCAEQYISRRALLLRYGHYLAKAADLPEPDEANRPHFADFANALRQKDEAAQKAYHDFLSDLALCINNIKNCYNPDIILINSAITKEFPELTSELTPLLSCSLDEDIPILASSLNDLASLYGGIHVAVTAFLGIKELHFS